MNKSLMKVLNHFKSLISLMVALNFFFALCGLYSSNSFCDTRTLCSTYYNREPSHLTSGEVLVLEPMAAQNTYPGSGKCGVKSRFPKRKPKFRKNTGTWTTSLRD